MPITTLLDWSGLSDLPAGTRDAYAEHYAARLRELIAARALEALDAAEIEAYCEFASRHPERALTWLKLHVPDFSCIMTEAFVEVLTEIAPKARELTALETQFALKP